MELQLLGALPARAPGWARRRGSRAQWPPGGATPRPGPGPLASAPDAGLAGRPGRSINLSDKIPETDLPEKLTEGPFPLTFLY